MSKFAQDPEKVSYHIHRIGYHFKAEVVDDACEELGYTLHRGHFIKFDDLQQQYNNSAVAATLAKYGIDPKLVENSNNKNHKRESPEQVRAAIKELFPNIPDNDLNEIVKHAWEEGTSRVGTNEFLELPRRVQLATIARIRHTYTDYDRLLRAFEWREARQMVEPECLQKLIEWRGENQPDEDDNELEEIVRETIVIDDDGDEAGRAGSEADDEDSAGLDAGNASDASIEVTHHVVADDDFGAETADKRTRRIDGRLQPARRNFEQQKVIAKQKILAARQRFRNPPPRTTIINKPSPFIPNRHQRSGVVQVNVQRDQSGHPADELVIDGRRYKRVHEFILNTSIHVDTDLLF